MVFSLNGKNPLSVAKVICRQSLSENDFEAVLVYFCCYDYGANASEAVQKISTRSLPELCQLTKTANFIATPMKKHI